MNRVEQAISFSLIFGFVFGFLSGFWLRGTKGHPKCYCKHGVPVGKCDRARCQDEF